MFRSRAEITKLEDGLWRASRRGTILSLTHQVLTVARSSSKGEPSRRAWEMNMYVRRIGMLGHSDAWGGRKWVDIPSWLLVSWLTAVIWCSGRRLPLFLVDCGYDKDIEQSFINMITTVDDLSGSWWSTPKLKPSTALLQVAYKIGFPSTLARRFCPTYQKRLGEISRVD